MPEPAQKCENNAIFMQNYTLKRFVAFRMAYSCCFGLRGNLEFPIFLQNKFYNINNRQGRIKVLYFGDEYFTQRAKCQGSFRRTYSVKRISLGCFALRMRIKDIKDLLCLCRSESALFLFRVANYFTKLKITIYLYRETKTPRISNIQIMVKSLNGNSSRKDLLEST